MNFIAASGFPPQISPSCALYLPLFRRNSSTKKYQQEGLWPPWPPSLSLSFPWNPCNPWSNHHETVPLPLPVFCLSARLPPQPPPRLPPTRLPPPPRSRQPQTLVALDERQYPKRRHHRRSGGHATRRTR